MVRRVFLPVAILVVLVTVSNRAVSSTAATPWSLCQLSKVRSPGNPSDLLVMGSSRTAAALDVAWMNQREAASRLHAERVVFTDGSELDRDLAYRTYAAHRGVPKTLGIELSFDTSGAEPAPLMATSRTQLAFDVTPYSDLVDDLRSREGISLSDSYLWSRLQSTVGFELGRIASGFEVALHDPKTTVRSRASCASNDAGFFDNYGTAHPAKVLTPLSPSDARLMSRMVHRVVNPHGRVDLKSQRAQAELKLLHDLVNLAQRQGVETIFLYYLPDFDERGTVVDLGAIQRMFPDTHIFDARTVINDPSRPLLRQQFETSRHVNSIGAYEISKAFLKEVQQTRR